MSKAIGLTFADELVEAGLGGLPISWGPAGDFLADALTTGQRVTLAAVYAAHDPERVPLATLKAEAGQIITAVVSPTAQLNLNAAMNVIGAKSIASRTADEQKFAATFAEGHSWIQAVRARVNELHSNGGKTPDGEDRWPEPSQTVRDLAAAY